VSSAKRPSLFHWVSTTGLDSIGNNNYSIPFPWIVG
jgi:hypothetical protein